MSEKLIMILIAFFLAASGTLSETPKVESKKWEAPATIFVEPVLPPQSPQPVIEVVTVAEETVVAPQPLPSIPLLDRTKPLYKVYKDEWEIKVDTNLQWYIRDLSEQFGFIEKYLYGVIISESAFKYDAVNGDCIGLCQVNKAWLEHNYVTHFTDDYAQRDLRNPYENLITTMEIWQWAVNAWNLDLSTEEGMMKVIYFHSCGRSPRDITNSWYFDYISTLANGLVPLQEVTS